MKKRNSFIRLITLLALTVSWALLAAPTPITINILHENGRALLAQRLEYWLNDDDHNKFILKCESDACSKWQLPQEVIGTTSISIIALVDRPLDPTCSDWFTGEMQPKRQVPGNSHFEVRLIHTETSCK